MDRLTSPAWDAEDDRLSGSQSRPIEHRESRDAQDALQVYLDLGEERSLSELVLTLRQDWTKTGRKSPSLSTVKNWSTWFGWQMRAEQFDAEIAARVRQERVKQEAKLRVARRQTRLDRAGHLSELVHRITHTQVEVEQEDGTTSTEWVMREPTEIGTAMLRSAIALSQEARAIEREELGVGPVVEESTTSGTGVIQTREELIKVYDDIDRMVKMMQASYQDKDTIEGEYQEDQMDDTQWEAGAWDVDDPEAADE